MNREETIRQRAIALGFDACGFASAEIPPHASSLRQWMDQELHGGMEWMRRNLEKRCNPQLVLPGTQTVIMVAASYHHPDFCKSTTASAPTMARYACYADYHDVLSEKLKILAEEVNQLGNGQDRSLWYVDTGPVLEREFAQNAGLGFVGKHNNLVNRQIGGNWWLLGAILTTIHFAPDAPEKNRCGQCSRCLNACPTRAILAPFKLDARRCISYLTIEHKGSIPVELRPAIGNHVFGCDDCLAACPWNRFARAGSLMAPHLKWTEPRLLEWLELSEQQFKIEFAGTPILRLKRRGLLRNICIVLANLGIASAKSKLEILSKDPDPIIAEHAQWAIEQLSK